MPTAAAAVLPAAHAFAGFDTEEFPGLATTAWLKANTDLAWIGFYLAPAPSHHDTGWMGQRAALAAQGWGLAAVYVGQELAGPGSHKVSPGQGSIDGAEAARLMSAAGFAAGSCVFLDLEDGAPFAEPRVGYVLAWAKAVKTCGYRPGAYCSHAIGAAVRTALAGAGMPEARLWTFRVSTVAIHHAAAPYAQPFAPAPADGLPVACQHDQEALIAAGGHFPLKVDLSASILADPSAP